MSRIILNLGLFAVMFCGFGCGTLDKRQSELASIKMQMGISEMQKNNLPLSLKYLLEAEELNPKDLQIQNNIGLVYFLRKRYDQSIKHFSRALEIDEKYTESRNNLARVYIEIKQYEKAEKLLAIVVEDLTFGNFVSSYNNMGLTKFNLKKYDEALSFFSKSIEAYREDCFSQLYMGRTLLELKQNKQAAARLDLASYFCKQSQVDEAHYFAAIAYYRLGRTDQSLNRFNDVIKFFENGQNRENAREMIQLIQKETK